MLQDTSPNLLLNLLPATVSLAGALFLIMLFILKRDLDSEGGHIIAGMLFLTIYLVLKGIGIDGGSTELMMLLIGLTLKKALEKVNG